MISSNLLARSPRFQAVLARSRKSLKSGKGFNRAHFWRTVNEKKGEYKTK